MCRCLKLHHHQNAGPWFAKSFQLTKSLLKRTLTHGRHPSEVAEQKEGHSAQTADKADVSHTRSFPISQQIFLFFRFCCPDFKRSMTADSLTAPTKLLLISSSSFSPRRAPQYVLWKPRRPTQSGAKRQRPFRRGGPGAVQLRAWLRAGRPRHAHLHHQCWKHCRLGLSCANLSRYAQLDTCLCVAVTAYEVFTSNGETV